MDFFQTIFKTNISLLGIFENYIIKGQTYHPPSHLLPEVFCLTMNRFKHVFMIWTNFYLHFLFSKKSLKIDPVLRILMVVKRNAKNSRFSCEIKTLYKEFLWQSIGMQKTPDFVTKLRLYTGVPRLVQYRYSMNSKSYQNSTNPWYSTIFKIFCSN